MGRFVSCVEEVIEKYRFRHRWAVNVLVSNVLFITRPTLVHLRPRREINIFKHESSAVDHGCLKNGVVGVVGQLCVDAVFSGELAGTSNGGKSKNCRIPVACVERVWWWCVSAKIVRNLFHLCNVSMHAHNPMTEFINWFVSLSLSVMVMEFAVIAKRAIAD